MVTAVISSYREMSVMPVFVSSREPRFIKAALVTPIVVLAAFSITICGWFYLYSGDLPNFDRLNQFAPADRDVATLCEGQQIPVTSYASMGRYLPAATRAAEGEAKMEAWQVARQLFCNDTDHHLSRQLREMKAAFRIRCRFSSEQITAIHLNEAYFGDGIYGVDSASRQFWGKRPSELSPAEAAMLVGLIKAPAFYSPQRHPDRAMSRRNEVLRRMVDRGDLPGHEAEAAMQTPISR